MTNRDPGESRWMRRALALAQRGCTPPNPMVGCVIVRGGAVVGEGYHPYAGAPHAEVFALQQAGADARGGTAYVSLEPCAHHGRTPPCADALIAAGVARVVAAVEDPDPRVAGRGLQRLREAGVAVSAGLLEQEARRVNAAFFYFQATGRPYVMLKAAMTLDGKTATRTGDSRWITGEEARRHVHRLRARSGAVLCGIGTVLADDPMLTARLPGRGAPRQPLRVVLDPRLRTPPGSRLARTAREVPLLIVATDDADEAAAASLVAAGAEVARLPTGPDGWIAPERVLEELGRRQVISVLVEGGGRTHAAFLAAGCAQRLLWYIAPKVAGGAAAPTPVEGEGAARMADAVRVSAMRLRRLGPDVLVECEPLFH